MARPPNRSKTEKVEITVPAQTHAYLVKLANAGALGPNEAAIASLIVINEVERMMREMRAETVLASPRDSTLDD